MRKRQIFPALFLAGVLALASLTACAPSDETAVSVSLDRNYAELTVGEGVQLQATVTPEGAAPTEWSSSDDSVAQVDENGYVLAVSEGTASVTVTAGNSSANCFILIGTPPEANSLTVEPERLTMEIGDHAALTARVEPLMQLYWLSSDSDVVSVSTTGTLIAKSAGTAVITVTTGGTSATCTVTVNPGVGSVCPDFTVDVKDGGTFTLSEMRGKVTVVNFWGTACVPCKMEMPYYAALAEKYNEEVAVVAIGASYDTAFSYELFFGEGGEGEAWNDYKITFALDCPQEGAGSAYELMGGGTAIPVTYIVDAEGVITFEKQGSMTEAELEEQILAALS